MAESFFWRGVARCRAGVFHGRDDRAPLFCAARRSCKWEGPSSGMTHFSAAPPARSSTGRRIAASQAAGCDGACVVAETRRRGGRAVQSWVKPEVDPPMGVARCRAGGVNGGLRPRIVHFSTTNCSNFHEWEAASLEILLVGFIRVYSGYSWFKDIRARWGGRRGSTPCVFDIWAIRDDGPPCVP